MQCKSNNNISATKYKHASSLVSHRQNAVNLQTIYRLYGVYGSQLKNIMLKI